MCRAGIILDVLGMCKEVTFASAAEAGDGKLLRLTAKSYDAESWAATGSIDIVFQDKKKRQKKTLANAGVTLAQLENGMCGKDAAFALSEYFIRHDGIFASDGAAHLYGRVAGLIESHGFRPPDCMVQDLGSLSRYCRVRIPKKDPCGGFRQCVQECRRIRRMEENAFGCTVKYAFFMEVNAGIPKGLIYCDTSMGRIFYDIATDEWGMPQKEQKRTRLRIENFDIDDIKRQLRAKYHVRNMSELMCRLKNTSSC